MDKKVYAVADSVPDGYSRSYLTPGKRYPVLREFGNTFEIIDDEGDTIHPDWTASTHLNGGNWRRVEEPEKKVYAVADRVPDDIRHLTAGKRYPVRWERGGTFEIIDDEGDTIHPVWTGSGHLEGGNWRRVEESTAVDLTKPYRLRNGDRVVHLLTGLNLLNGRDMLAVAEDASGRRYPVSLYACGWNSKHGINDHDLVNYEEPERLDVWIGRTADGTLYPRRQWEGTPGIEGRADQEARFTLERDPDSGRWSVVEPS